MLRLIFVSIIVAFGCNFQFGYHISIINTAADLFRSHLNESSFAAKGYHISETAYPTIWSLIVNIFLVGLTVGCVPVSFLSEKFGRKKLMIANNLLALAGTGVICGWPYTHLLELLVLGRFLLGVHGGVFVVLQSIYLTEISPAKYRGIFASFQEIFLVGTVALGVIVGLPQLLGNEKNFIHLLWLGGIPSLLQTVVLLFCPESPKHLLLTDGNEKAAEQAIRFFQGTEVDVNAVKKLIQEEAECCDPNDKVSIIRKLVEMSPEVKRAILVGVVAAMAQVFTAILVLENFSTLMFRQAGISESNSQLASVGITSLHFLLSIVALNIVERLPRRVLLLSSLAGCVLCNGVFVTFAQLSQYYPQHQWMGYIAIAAYVSHIVSFCAGAGPLPWFLTSEMVPQEKRSLAQSISMIIMNLVMLTTNFVYLPLSHYLSSYTILIIFVGPSVICFFLLYRYMPETRGREISEVLEKLRHQINQPDKTAAENLLLQEKRS